jgi:hypothetical protein
MNLLIDGDDDLDSATVVGVAAMSDRYHTPSGLRVGMIEADVLAAFSAEGCA